MRIRWPRPRSRGALGIAAFIAIPLFFSSLMASTLALEKPHVVQWTSGGRLLTTWHDPSTATEARIWLWALVPPVLLVIVGLAGSLAAREWRRRGPMAAAADAGPEPAPG